MQDNHIEPLRALAVSAGEAILEIYDHDFDFDLKDDRSPITQADRKSNAIIVDGLRRIFPEIPVISEENRRIPYDTRRSWKKFWLVDPLDGTKEFIKKNGEFTVNIALVEDGVPVLGIVYVPVTRDMYYTLPSGGAFRQTGSGSPVRIGAKQSAPSDEFVVVASRSHKNQKVDEYIARLREKYPSVRLISAGSALKFCLVAEGAADIYIRTGPTMEWDTAAGHALSMAAGKQVYRFDSDEVLAYNKPGLKNGWFIVR